MAIRQPLLGAIAAWLLCFTACQEIDRQQPAAVAVQFTTSVSSSLSHGGGRGEASTRTRSEALHPSSPSRAYNDTWEPADEVGIFMLAASGTSGADVPGLTDGNHHYATDNETDAKSVGLVAGTDPLYFPVDGSDVRFVSYGPYRDDLTDRIYPVNVGGTTPQVLSDLDLIYHCDADDASYNKYSTSVPLTFKHQLSKITISVTLGEGAPDIDFSDRPGLSISGMPTTAVFDLNSGSLSTLGGTDASITPAVNSSSDEVQAIFEAILVPHSGSEADTDGRVFTFSFGGIDYVYTLGSDREFVAGAAYLYNFKISANRVVLNEATLVDWKQGVVKWGGYLLTATTTEFDVTKLGVNKNTGVPFQVDFRTTATGSAPKVITSTTRDANGEEVDWITMSLSESTISNGWKHWTLTFEVPRNPYNSARTGYIITTIEGLTITITVTQDAGEGLQVFLANPTTAAISLGYAPSTGSFAFGTNSAQAPVIKYSTTGNWEDATETVPSECDWFTVGITTKSTYVNSSNSNLNDNRYTTTYSYTINPSSRTSRGGLYVHARVEDDPNTDKMYKVTQNPIQITTQNTTYVADGMSNCYVVGGGGTVVFRVTRAYSNALTSILRVGGMYDGEFYLEKVWEDAAVVDYVSSKVEYSGVDGVVTIKATKNPGNAVVALKRKDTGAIVWSYHIWRSDVGTINNWMDRSLGATGNTPTNATATLAAGGLYYQWGRKDPFPKTTSLADDYGGEPSYWIRANQLESTAYDVITSIRKPGYFITNDRWSGSEGSVSWNTSSGQKTIYDPCPSGYRVPHYTAWNISSEINNDNWSSVPGTSQKFGYSAAYGGYYISGGCRKFSDASLHTHFAMINHWSHVYDQYDTENAKYRGYSLFLSVTYPSLKWGFFLGQTWTTNGYMVRCRRE